MAVNFPSDLEIARRARLLPMSEVAAGMGIDPGLIEPYGTEVAKIRLEAIEELADRPRASISIRGVPPIASRIVCAGRARCLPRGWPAVGTAISQLRIRRISGSKRGSDATVAGCRSPRYSISRCDPIPDSSGGSQA